MTETDLQLGGGYTYQWECAILLALNYFFEPVRYNPTLFDLIQDFLGEVAEIHLEGEDRETGVDLQDINLVSTDGDRRILIQVKTKQAEGKRWTPGDSLLLKSLYRFYDSGFFAERPDEMRFVFLTNRGFNPALVKVKDAIREGTLDQCPEVDQLHQRLTRYAARDKKEATADLARFRQILARTALVEYLAVDEVKANVQAKLQAHGRRDWEQAHAVLFEHFSRQSTRIGGGTVTRESIVGVLGPPSLMADLRPDQVATLHGPGGIGKKVQMPHRSAMIQRCRANLINGREADLSARMLGDIAIRHKDGEAVRALWEAICNTHNLSAIIDPCAFTIGRVLQESLELTPEMEDLCFEILHNSTRTDSELVIEKFAFTVGEVALKGSSDRVRQRATELINVNVSSTNPIVRDKYGYTRIRIAVEVVIDTTPDESGAPSEVQANAELELTSLYRQLAEARQNLRLIRERKSQYVLETDIPLQLIKEERQTLERIKELEQAIGGESP